MHNGHHFDGRDLARARDALACIPPDLPRDEWVRVGMAAQGAGLDFDAFDAWSAGAESYSERDARATWRSFKPGKGVGAGTLFKVATEHGWRMDGHKPLQRPTQGHRKAPEPHGKVTARVGAAEVWSRCKPAAAEHPYIEAKNGTPEGLRVVADGDPLRIAGASVAGWLVVPVLGSSLDEPVSLQFIPPPGAGKKLNLPGAPMAGMFMVGERVPGATVYLCEGIGQAWACWKATGFAAVVCFGWGRVRGVAAELRRRDASARLVLVPDKGKEAEAEAIAREVAGLFVPMPADAPDNFDPNDYAAKHGGDALEVLLSAPQGPAQRFRLLGSADLRALPPLAWRVRGVLPAQGLASVYGPSGSGKSFLVLDMAAAIAEGLAWFGYRVKAAPVVYVPLEGQAGFRLRAAAWETRNGRPLPVGLRLVLQPFKLTEPQDVPDLAAAVLSAGDGAVTILDTLNAAAPEADENASADMGRILEAAKELQRLTGGLVLLVHHTGKDASKGLRGHSSLFAALDAALEVVRDGDRKEWRVAKAKDGKDGDAHPFNLDPVELGDDADGEPVTSCVVTPAESAGEDAKRAKLPTGGTNQRAILDALRPMFKASPVFGKAGAPSVRPCVELESAIAATCGRLVCAADRRAERTREAIQGLVNRGVLGHSEGWLWMV